MMATVNLAPRNWAGPILAASSCLVVLFACDSEWDEETPSSTGVEEATGGGEEMKAGRETCRPLPISRPKPYPIDGRGTIAGKVSFGTPLMEELALKRPAPFFTVLYVEMVPDTLWAREEASARETFEDPYLTIGQGRKQLPGWGRYVNLYLTDRYRDVRWGMGREDGGWVPWPAAVVALERGDSVEVIFPGRYVDRYGGADLLACGLVGEEPTPGLMKLDNSWGAGWGRGPSPTRLPEDTPAEMGYNDMSPYSYGRFTIAAVGCVMELAPDHAEWAYVVCVQNPFYTTIDLGVEREFRIENVPPGSWRVRAFDAHLTGGFHKPEGDPDSSWEAYQTIRVPVEVKAGQVSRADVVFEDYMPSAPWLGGEDETPSTASGFLQRGLERYIGSDFAGSTEDLERAVKMDDKLWQAWAAVGFVLARTGEAEKAREAFERANSLDPKGRHWSAEGEAGLLINPDDIVFLQNLRETLDEEKD